MDDMRLTSPELRSIEVFVQGKSADESLGEEAAGLMKQITDLLYSTEVSHTLEPRDSFQFVDTVFEMGYLGIWRLVLI